jgi:outer membrane cobalamin receptor
MLLLALPFAASAQKPDSLPKDTVTLTPVVVSATRLPAVSEVVRGLTGRTATLDGEDLDSRGVRTLADALEELPGVTTADELGAPAQLDVTLRGFQVSPTVGLPQGITVYVDGVRVNEPDANEVNFDVLPLEDVERVDVVYGPSVLFGRNSLGAAVNLVMRCGGRWTVRVEPRELAATKRSCRRATGRMWDYYVGLRYEYEDGWRR